MILTADERRTLLGLLALLLIGQGVAFLRDEKRARPDRELSEWLTRQQAARAKAPGAREAGMLGILEPILTERTAAGPGSQGAGEGVLSDTVASDQSIEDKHLIGVGKGEFEATPAPGSGAGRRSGGPRPAPIEPARSIPPGVAESGLVAINHASPRDLEALPGVGPALARRIIEERARSGPFRSPRDLLRVKGIGPKKLASLEARVQFDP